MLSFLGFFSPCLHGRTHLPSVLDALISSRSPRARVTSPALTHAANAMLNDTTSGAGSRGTTPLPVLSLLVVVVFLLLERISFKRVNNTDRKEKGSVVFGWGGSMWGKERVQVRQSVQRRAISYTSWTRG